MNLRFQFLAIIALVFFSAGVFAAEDWGKKLMDQGWVKLNLKQFEKNANTTWYGIGKYDKWILYVYPSGKKLALKVTKNFYAGWVGYATRVSEKNGLICHKGTLYWGDTKCRTFWIKEDVLLAMDDSGFEVAKWTVKKGNPENFK